MRFDFFIYPSAFEKYIEISILSEEGKLIRVIKSKETGNIDIKLDEKYLYISGREKVIAINVKNYLEAIELAIRKLKEEY